MGNKKRLKKPKMVELNETVVEDKPLESELPEIREQEDPNTLLSRILKENNLELDFGVVKGTVLTNDGFIKLEKPLVTIKASYVSTTTG